MDIIETLKADYQRFPVDQTYSIYAPNVYFQDPVFSFRGLKLYKWMIKFIQIFFKNVRLELSSIKRNEDTIKSEWVMSWDNPLNQSIWNQTLPWKPHISISGWSELQLNTDNLIVSHIDYWHCSRLDVLKQHLFSLNNG